MGAAVHRARRIWIGLGVLLAVLLFPGAALAHANLERSDPPAGAALARAPARVQLWFTEEVEPAVSTIAVYDANRRRVDRGDGHVAADDPRSLVVDLEPNLPAGSYVIAWQTQSKVDGHITRGNVPFGVGTAAVPLPTAVPESAAVSGSPLEMALRGLALLSALTLVGSLVFWLVQDGGIGGSRAAGPAVLLPGQGRIAAAALMLHVVSRLGLLVLQAAIATGVGLPAALGRPLLETVTATRYGMLVSLQVLLGVSVGVVLCGPVRRGAPGARRAAWSALLPGALLLGAITLNSHGAALGALTPLGIAADWLHLAAAAVWTGGVIQLAAFAGGVIRARGLVNGTRRLGPVVGEFARLAGLALALVLLSGAVQAVLHVGTLEALIGSGYGQALLVKMLFLLPALALAGIHHVLVRPALAAADRPPALLARAAALAASFRWTVLLEAAALAAVVLATGVLTSLSPARQFASAGAGPLALAGTADDLAVSLGITPAVPGLNRFTVDVRDAAGGPAAGIDRVVLRVTDLDGDLGVVEAPLGPIAAGRFQADNRTLATAGRWQVDVVISRPGRSDAVASFRFLVTPSGGQLLAAPGLAFGWAFYVGLAVAAAGLLALVRARQVRAFDARRALAIAGCAILLGGLGGVMAVRDVQRAAAEAAAQVAALNHPATAASIARGAAIYQQNCAMCHGADARGDGPLAASLNPPPSNLIVHVPQHPDADLESWIANGFPGSAMPAFKDRLSEQERWDVLNYLKAQVQAAQRGAGPAAAAPYEGLSRLSGRVGPARAPGSSGDEHRGRSDDVRVSVNAAAPRS